MTFKTPSHSIDNTGDNTGQAVILSVITLPLFLILLYGTLHFSRMIERKMMLQNGIDAALLTGIEILASGLNSITDLNQKLIHLHGLLLLVQAGRVISTGSSILTEALIRKMIQAIALKQDLIKKSFPLLAFEKAMIIARKNKTPHILFTPPLFQYALQRKPPQNGLPSPYELSPNFSQFKTWGVQGFFYRGGYRAKAQAQLEGPIFQSALTTRRPWKGVFCE